MRKIPLLFCIAAVLGSIICVKASSGQTVSSIPERDTVASAITTCIPVVKKRTTARMLIIPVTLITYGVASIKTHELKEINIEFKEELWLEHAHKKLPIDNYLQWSPAAAVFGLDALGIKGAHSLADQTIIYGISTAIMASSVYTVKSLSKQWRPDNSNERSFPSGHTATAFAAAEFMRKEYKDVSIWYGVAGYAAATATGYLRMYNNKHWLGDVVAGAGIGILSTDLAYYLYPSVRSVSGTKTGSSTVLVPFYNQGTAGLSMVHQF